MLKVLFKKLSFTLFICCISAYTFSQGYIKCEDAKKHIGETISVCGKVYSGSFLEKSKTKPTLLNMGAAYPDQMLTILVPLEYRKNFSVKPEDFFIDKEICVTGKIIDYKGRAEIIISSPSEIQLQADFIPKTDIVEKTPETPVQPTNDFNVILTMAVNVRSQPSKDGSILAVANIGTKVIVHRSENGWSYVTVEVINAKLNKNEMVNGYIKNNVLK